MKSRGALGDLFFAATGDHRKNRALTNRVDPPAEAAANYVPALPHTEKGETKAANVTYRELAGKQSPHTLVLSMAHSKRQKR